MTANLSQRTFSARCLWSAMGQKPCFGHQPTTSGLPLTTPQSLLTAFFTQIVVGSRWRSMDGVPGLLACVPDDRGLLYLSVCNTAFMPRGLYASCWWRHGVVLRSWISTLGNSMRSSGVRIDRFLNTPGEQHSQSANRMLRVVG